MAGLNKVMVIGNVGRPAELKYMANGTPQAKFSLAVNSKSKGEEHTEWINVVLWGDTAENVSQYIQKGKQVYVEGRLQTRSWESDDGTKHYMTEVHANSVQLLGQRESKDQGRRTNADVDVDDLPFS